MPRVSDRWPDNATGDLYVDRSCRACGTCRVIAPTVFDAADAHSVVREQPRDAASAHRAYMALLACPAGAIGAAPRADLRPARDAFPDFVLEDVALCGYVSERSGCASAWFVRRDAGNVLVDVPRFARPLVERVAAAGGVRWIFVTRGGHAGEADAWARRFGAERVAHRAAGIEAERTFDEALELDADLRAVSAPGRAEGGAALLFRDEVLFPGDLVCGGPAGGLGFVPTAPVACADRLRGSLRALATLAFRHVLPARGSPWHGDIAAGQDALHRLADADPGAPAPRGEPRAVPEGRSRAAPALPPLPTARRGANGAANAGPRSPPERSREREPPVGVEVVVRTVVRRRPAPQG